MSTERKKTSRFDGHKPIILAVDDDAINLALVRDCLAGFNYTVLVAEDGESAVSRADYAHPDLILLDVMMPGMDGYETCRLLKQQESTRDIPVIFMSALGGTGHKVMGLETGAVDYVTKPFQQDELLARVRVHLSILDLNRRLKETNELLEARVEARTMDLSIANRVLEKEIVERQAAQEQLRQSQKMEAIGTLAGGVAHDFNNILTAIMGFGSILRAKLEGEAKLAQYADNILNAADKAAKLTYSLLAFSRKQIIETKPEEVSEIVRTIDKLLFRVIGDDIELRCSLTPEELVIMGDGSQIEQMLMNLAVNGRDAMPNGGILSLRTERVELMEKLPAVSLKPGSYARITVSDTGCGISEDIRQRIFEPFFTTKDVGKGTGLGLSIVHGIIKQHDGAVTVESEVGKGTSFKIYLPLAASYYSRFESDPAVPIPGGVETILLAEDNDDVRSFMVQALEDYGYHVIEALNGEEALEKYRANRGLIQLVMLDVVMPRMNGREVYEMVRKEGGQAPVLFCSGYTDDIIEQKGMVNEKGVDFLPKPVTAQVLLAKVREILDLVL
ncbi:MAG: response regulator [Desulfuromonadaceae bacterium]